MSPRSSHEVRAAFLDFFRQRQHEAVSSGPLVPQNDPTLMFANAGMVQFKDLFTGREKRAYSRAASSQKCIRISGKHNDLENVGVTARHHTFFEMLGNFSFGDYFKKEAITWGWEFITKTLQIPPEKLVVTIFAGEGSLPADEEAGAIWREVSGFPEERIIRCGPADNFWSMGDTGPCGPCSEIHYFHGEETADPRKFGQEPDAAGRGWTELWNLVFMQFERHADGRLESLPAPSIDTGAGLERLCCVTQGVRSNYDTDLLRPVVDLASEIAKKKYGGTLAPDDVSMRVLADHARTTAMLIAEGIFPDRAGRSYVLRRVMRRAIRHGHRLGIDRLFFHECAAKVVETMGAAYPELVERRALIEDITKQEEDRFRKTLSRGLDLLAENKEWLEQEGKRVLPGRVAWTLYDTYGFPDDLQEVIGREQGFDVDRAGFEDERKKAKERSSFQNDAKVVATLYKELATEPTTFVGYDRERAESSVVALVSGGARVDSIAAGQQGEVITALTPFYAESGGQVGDRGEIRTQDGTFEVHDTQKIDGVFVHSGKVVHGWIARTQPATLSVDHASRSATRRNHSATHLLHWALRTVLGEQAMQKGSLVGPDRLRFDYAGTRPLTAEEIARIEDLVNTKILENAPIETEVLPMDEAKKRGAIGIFEEKYGAVVRMLRMTSDSIELCGGTHAARTGDLGLFKVISESGLAAGVRRVEAATGTNALRHVREVEGELSRAADLVKAAPQKTAEKIEKMLLAQKELTREVEQLKRQLLSGGAGSDPTKDARDVGGAKALALIADVGDATALRELADQLRDKLAPAVVLIGAATKDGKALLICTVSKDLTSRFSAGAIVKETAAIVGGGGGGRPDFAQAGGSDPSRLKEVVDRFYALVST